MLLLGALAVLAACSKSSQDMHMPFAHRAKPQAPPIQQDGNVLATDADMVLAVTPAGDAAPVSLKFRLESRPLVGSAVRVEVLLIPSADAQISHLHAFFSGGDSLQVQSDRGFDAEELQPKQVLRHEFTIVPQQEGVLRLQATVDIQQGDGEITRTFTIPVIAADHPV